MTKLTFLTAADKPAIAAALAAVGVKARIRVIHLGLRVCFEGSQSAVLSALNGLGLVAGSGQPFSAFSFNQPHEIFVRYRVA